MLSQLCFTDIWGKYGVNVLSEMQIFTDLQSSVTLQKRLRNRQTIMGITHTIIIKTGSSEKILFRLIALLQMPGVFIICMAMSGSYATTGLKGVSMTNAERKA